MNPAFPEPGSLNPGPRSLTRSRFLDFWLLGGASIPVWLAMTALQGFRHQPGALGGYVDGKFAALAGATGLLAVVVNNPHFMASYQIGYGRGLRYVATHWFSMLLVPAVLALTIGLGWLFYGQGTQGADAVPWLSGAFRAVGLNPPTGPLATPGGVLMTLAIQSMWLTVGWHYAKQTYGCVMTVAHLDGYPLAGRERDLIRWTLHAIWVSSFLKLNLHRNEYALFNVPFYGLGFPVWSLWLACALALVGLAACARVALQKRAQLGVTPGANLVVPLVAFCLWWFPLFDQSEFTLSLVPLFHGLQYLPFVFRVDRASYGKRFGARAEVMLAGLALALVGAGVLSMELIPSVLDQALDSPHRMNAFFFAAAFTVFINVHHYFLDAGIWRSNDPFVREGLFGG